MATLQEEFAKYQGDGSNQVNAMYDAQKEANIASLENTYQKNLSNAQAAKEQISPAYQARANDMAVQYERNRRNLNEQAAARGLNTGTASQQQLALQNVWNRDYAGLRTAQANALKEADRGINDLTTDYQNNVRIAIADGDYRRAAALLDQYKQQYSQNLSNAKTLAGYGDFSGYKGIYNDQQIENMRKTWIMQNPQLAYNTGNMTADEFYAATGQWPLGYTPPSSGGGDWSGGSTYISSEFAGWTPEQIRNFQASQGLTVDGIAGHDTEAAMKAVMNSDPPAADPGSAVRKGSAAATLGALGTYEATRRK